MTSPGPQPFSTVRRLALALLLATGAACGGDTRRTVVEPPRLVRVELTPATPTVQTGGTVQFRLTGSHSDGTSSDVEAAYTAEGGTVTPNGLYTAGQTAGTFRVIATVRGSSLADTSLVTVTTTTPPPPVLAGVTLTPPTATVAAGGSVQFTGTGVFSNGSTAAVPVSYTATGGTVSAAGLYTAGQTPGSYRVIVTAQGTSFADTSIVNVTAVSGGSYQKVAGDDWQYADKAQLRAADLFYWLDSRNVYDFVDLVPDATFGRAVRITFPQNSGTLGSAPRIQAGFPAMDRMWFRWRMKFTPGWTTAGPDPAGHANSYKIAFWLWEGYTGRGEIEYSNTDQYVVGTGVNSNGQALRYTETQLPGSAPGSFGRAGTEWSDNEWYEFVVHYEKTGPTSANQRYWRRRLTQGGQTAPGPWIFHGYSFSGSTTPQVSRIELGVNKNKNNPTTMYLTWGPWEVVDGSRYPNPWSMPNL